MSPTATRKQRIVSAFDRAAQYDAHSALQREVAVRLWAEMAAHLPVAPRTVLEIGCGTGHLTGLLCENLPDARIHATDVASAMVARCQGKYAGRHRSMSFGRFDGEAPGSLDEWDLVCSSMTFQWFEGLERLLADYARRMRQGACLSLSLPGSGSLDEWRVFAGRARLPVGVSLFPSAATLQGWLANAGLEPVRVVEQTVAETFANPLEFLRAVRGAGATVPAAGYEPAGTSQLRSAMRSAINTPFRCTWVIVHAIARRTENSIGVR